MKRRKLAQPLILNYVSSSVDGYGRGNYLGTFPPWGPKIFATPLLEKCSIFDEFTDRDRALYSIAEGRHKDKGF